MAFPFFGRKETKLGARPLVRPPVPVPAEPANQAADKSTLTPVLSSALPDPRPLSEFPDDYDLQSLDFTTSGNGNLVFGNQHLQISETDRSLHPAAEQAAMTFANGNDADAINVVECVLAAEPKAPELLWRMLFDLYQFSGKREAFEACGVDYAVAFEKSPPSWRAPEKSPVGVHAGAPLVSLSGTLTEASAASIDQLRRLAERAKELRIDVARVRDVDAVGGDLLMAAIADCKRRKLPVYLVNAPALATLLEKKVQPGEARGESLWMLLLETYQQLGRQDPFEELALNYAVTFEKSPPSWEPRAVVTKEVAPPPSARPAPNALCGDVIGAGADAFAGLASVADASDEVAIDCSGLRRMDFVSAGTLLNLVAKWQAAGKPVRLIEPNALIEGLFEVLGISSMATVVHAKKV